MRYSAPYVIQNLSLLSLMHFSFGIPLQHFALCRYMHICTAGLRLVCCRFISILCGMGRLAGTQVVQAVLSLIKFVLSPVVQSSATCNLSVSIRCVVRQLWFARLWFALFGMLV